MGSEEELREVMRAAYGNARASTLLVVEFYAKWCNSCRRLYPRLCKLASQEQDVLFCKIDFDANKDLCRKLGVVKLPYFHLYNGSGSRLADFASSLEPTKFKRITDAIDEHRAPRCALPGGGKKKPTQSISDDYLASLVKLHRVTFAWRGQCEDVQITGDVAGGWTHTLPLRKDDGDEDDPDAPHAVTCILPTGTFRFKFIVDGKWAVSPNYPIVADEQDNVNNEIFVGAASWPFEWVSVPALSPAGPPLAIETTPVSQDVKVPDKELAAREGFSGPIRERRRQLPRSNNVVQKKSAPSQESTSGSDGEGPSSDGPAGGPFHGLMPHPPDQGGGEPEARDAPTALKSAVATPEENREQAAPGEAKVDAESFPKKIAVSQDDYLTKGEHNQRIIDEAKALAEQKITEAEARRLAFRRLKFSREELAVAAANPETIGTVQPSKGVIPSATKAEVLQKDLLTLEERVKRIERILDENNLSENGWLNEG